jgi:hypothetical protein
LWDASHAIGVPGQQRYARASVESALFRRVVFPCAVRAIRSGTPGLDTAPSRSSFSVQLTVIDCASIPTVRPVPICNVSHLLV